MSDDFMTGYVAGQNEGNNSNGCMDGWGGNSWIWIIVVFALLFGWGGNGFGRGGFGGGSGAASAEGFNLATDFATLERKMDGINSGLCNLGYNQLDQVNGVNSNLAAGFASVNNAVCTLGYQNAQLINGLENTVQNSTWQLSNGQTALANQLANCCCENRQMIADVKYTMATDTCATQRAIADAARNITDNQSAGTRAILDALTQNRVEALQDKIAALTAQNSDLKFAASQQAQNAYITASQAAQTQAIIDKLSPCPYPAYIVPNPNVCTPTGNGCGCS